jgi:hypothetical protein
VDCFENGNDEKDCAGNRTQDLTNQSEREGNFTVGKPNQVRLIEAVGLTKAVRMGVCKNFSACEGGDALKYF